MILLNSRALIGLVTSSLSLVIAFGEEGGSQGEKGQSALRAVIPDLYDDFSDGKYQDRTGKDPWGRPLPEWKLGGSQGYKGGKVDASSGSLRFISGEACGMSLPSSVHIGTWKLRYRWPNGAPGNTYAREIEWYFIQSQTGSIRSRGERGWTKR